MKQKEQNILGIFAIILGIIALVSSWLPIISFLSFFIAIAALVLGIIGITLNLKTHKMVAIIGTTLALISMIIALTTQVLSTHMFKDFARIISHPYRDSNIWTEDDKEIDLPDSSVDDDDDDLDEDDDFTWTQEQFDALIEGDLANKGKGGSNYKDIIRTHGIPDSEANSSVGGNETKRISYTSFGSGSKAVVLTFAKQDNGQFLLIHKYAIGLKQQDKKDSGMRI